MFNLFRKFLSRSYSNQKTKGFTLIEVMVAVSILSIAVLAASAGSYKSSFSNRHSRETSFATARAEEILERMRRNRSELASYNGFNTADSSTRPAAAGKLQTDYDQWLLLMQDGISGTVQVTSNTPITNSHQVAVAITIPSRASNADASVSAPARTIAINTIFSN